MNLKKVVGFSALFFAAITFKACDGGSGNDSQAGENEGQTSEYAEEEATENGDDKESGESQQEPDALWVYNERFDFKVKVPEEWQAQEKSDNEDGIFVKTGNPGTDIRVFGQTINEVSREMEAEDCKTTEPFEFRDGKTGKKCLGGNLVKYWREKDDERITVYIEAPKEWRKANREKLEKMAKSLSRGGVAS